MQGSRFNSAPKTRFVGEDFTAVRGDVKSQEKNTIIVTRKVAKRAVTRNRIRRLIRESLRSIGLDENLTVIVKKDLSALKMVQVKRKLEKVLKNV